MAIAFRSIAGAEDVTNATPSQLTISVPAGVADGDILIAVLIQRANTGATAGGWSCAGWTTIEDAQISSRSGCSILWRRASSEPANYTFACATTGTMLGSAGVIAAYSGAVASGNPVDTFLKNFNASGVAPSSQTAPSITPTYNNTMLIAAGAWSAAAGNEPSAITGACTNYRGRSGSTAGAWRTAVGDVRYTSGGAATGTSNFTNQGTVSFMMWHIALIEAGAVSLGAKRGHLMGILP